MRHGATSTQEGCGDGAQILWRSGVAQFGVAESAPALPQWWPVIRLEYVDGSKRGNLTQEMNFPNRIYFVYRSHAASIS